MKKTDCCLENTHYLILYFGNLDTPECREFQEQLRLCHPKIIRNHILEIVYVSCDVHEDSYDTNRKFFPFLSVPFEQKQLRISLSTKYQVKIIPSYVLLDSNGFILTNDRAWPFYDKNCLNFPWKGEAKVKKNKGECLLN